MYAKTTQNSLHIQISSIAYPPTKTPVPDEKVKELINSCQRKCLNFLNQWCQIQTICPCAQRGQAGGRRWGARDAPDRAGRTTEPSYLDLKYCFTDASCCTPRPNWSRRPRERPRGWTKTTPQAEGVSPCSTWSGNS